MFCFQDFKTINSTNWNLTFFKKNVYKIKFAIRNACYPKYLQEHYFLSAEAYRLSVMEEDSTMLHINGIENAPLYCTEILMKTKYLLSFSILVGFWRDCRRASHSLIGFMESWESRMQNFLLLLREAYLWECWCEKASVLLLVPCSKPHTSKCRSTHFQPSVTNCCCVWVFFPFYFTTQVCCLLFCLREKLGCF